MKEAACEYTKRVTIVNELGLHARSAAQIAHIAREARSRVWIKKEDEIVDASEVIDILTLACGKGTAITLKIENLTDKKILDRIAALVEMGFRE
jgi:phosphocarrier protein HPr